ncbi:MAG: protein kinase [Acetobacteraceae bacterium]
MTKPDTIPARLGKYEVRGVLGRGSMGIVYDCWDPAIDRRVAIKTVGLINDADFEAEEAVARFRKEAQAAGRLSHAGIVAVYDYGETADTAFIVMEFVEGQTLQDRLDAGPMPDLGETGRIMQQVLTALHYIHSRGVIHRDIKPSNVMITAEGDAKLTDFGIARIESSSMTKAGTILGTPAYMSPEQLTAGPADARSDIYAAGVLLYQLLTGKRPFEGGLVAIINKALNTVPPPPSTVRAEVPAALDLVVATAMAREPADRYPTAAAFGRAMREVLAAPVATRPPADAGDDVDRTLVRRSAARGTSPKRSPLFSPGTAAARTIAPSAHPNAGLAWLWAGAALLLVLIGTGGWLLLRVPQGPQPPPAATKSGAEPAVAGLSLPNRPPEPSGPQPLPAPTAASPAAPVPSPPAPPLPAVQAAPAETPPQGMRDALARLAGTAFCALPRFGVSDDGRVSVSGPVGAGVAEAALRDAVRSAVPGAPVTWGTRTVNGVYCGVLDAVRPIAQASGPALDLSFADGMTRFPENAVIRPLVRMPDFQAYLVVDYFSSDGEVLHLLPVAGGQIRAEAPNATVAVLDRMKQRLEAGPPFGVDVMVAIASSVPLFPAPPARSVESARDYIAALTAAIDTAQRRGARLSGRAVPLDLEAR